MMTYQYQLSALVHDHLHAIYKCLCRAFMPVYLSLLCYGHVLLCVMSLCCHVVVLWVLCAVVCLCCSLVDHAFEAVGEL
jgi:hypothetical protein